MKRYDWILSIAAIVLALVVGFTAVISEATAGPRGNGKHRDQNYTPIEIEAVRAEPVLFLDIDFSGSDARQLKRAIKNAMPHARFTQRRHNADLVVSIDARRFNVHTTELGRSAEIANYKPRKMAVGLLSGVGPLLYATWDEVYLEARVNYKFRVSVKERRGRMLGTSTVRDHTSHTLTVGDNFVGHSTKGAVYNAPYPNRRVAALFDDGSGHFERNARLALIDEIAVEIAQEIRTNLGFGRERYGYMGY